MILDRSVAYAMSVSVLWHLFWFFTVNVNVTPKGFVKAGQTKVVSLGAMLDDEIFKTLVESRPESTRASYRELSEFRPATELPPPAVQRQVPGDVTSLPGGEKLTGSLRSVISGVKASALSSESVPASTEEPFTLTQGLLPSQILSRPEPPAPAGALTVSFELDASGRVVSANTTVSSGDPSVDRAYEAYVLQWVFAPEAALGLTGERSAEAVFGGA